MYVFWSVILAAIGVIMIFNPKLFFDFTESWKSVKVALYFKILFELQFCISSYLIQVFLFIAVSITSTQKLQFLQYLPTETEYRPVVY